jgi:hypothetical protein
VVFVRSLRLAKNANTRRLSDSRWGSEGTTSPRQVGVKF